MSRVDCIWREMLAFYYGSILIWLKIVTMRPRKRKHPNYKAYLAYQLRIMPEKFPFLSSQQIKAKILTTWESFSPEKKNNWAMTGNSSQGSDGTGVSPSYKSPPPHRQRYYTQKIPMPTRRNTKFTNTSKPKSSIKHSTPSKNFITKSPSSEPISEFYEISLPERRLKNSESTKGGFKEVRFKKHTSVCVVSSDENSEPLLPVLDASQVTDEFNCIESHNLVVEQETLRESDASKCEEITSDKTNVWRGIFGDATSIWEEMKVKNCKEEKAQLMCGLFEEAKPGKHVFDRRFLASLCPSDAKSRRDLFDGDNDDDIFA